MSRWKDDASRIVPAHLEFLAIYNPSLGTTDDQILFFHSRRAFSKRSRRKKTQSDEPHEQNFEDGGLDVNGQLRQIGLAQGMVAFAKFV